MPVAILRFGAGDQLGSGMAASSGPARIHTFIPTLSVRLRFVTGFFLGGGVFERLSLPPLPRANWSA